MKIGESTNFTMAKLVREESSKSMGSLLTSISTTPKNFGSLLAPHIKEEQARCVLRP